MFRGRLFIAVPHMDDCVLACGGTIASLPSQSDVHLVYATDGSRSPPTPLGREHSPDLPGLRRAETKRALGVVGVPESNLHFLDLPDGELRRRQAELQRSLASLLRDHAPDHLLMPFRYDRHPDHLALNRAARRALGDTNRVPSVFEYFVYYRWRLLPGWDVRAHLRADLLTRIDITNWSTRKRRALECFRTQTTRYFPWQVRPILTPALLDEVCRGPELFLRIDPSDPDVEIFERWGRRFRVVHRVEPPLKRLKDLGLRALPRRFSALGSAPASDLDRQDHAGD